MRILTASFCAALASQVATAHDLRPGLGALANVPVTWTNDRLAYMPTDQGMEPPFPSSAQAPFYVIGLPNKWANQQTIHVCFQGGTDALRNRILTVAKLWFVHTNLKLGPGLNGPNCLAHDRSEVRIGFDEPGAWSYVGNDSLADELISKSETSMNLQGFDKKPPPEPDFTGYVLHEWGHALGLHHEHQSPGINCADDYKWPVIYAYYKAHYKWDQKMVDDNYRPLTADHSAYDWSVFDPDSIMIYGTDDPSFLTHGTKDKCYFHYNNSLSKTDIRGIQQTYPIINANSALNIQQKTLSAIVEMDLNPNYKKALSRQLELVNFQLKPQ